MSSTAFRDVSIALWAGEVKSELIRHLMQWRWVAEEFPFLVRMDLETKRLLRIPAHVRLHDLEAEDIVLVQEIISSVQDVPALIRREVQGEWSERVAAAFERDLNAIRAQLSLS